jgi:hypothetical protein
MPGDLGAQAGSNFMRKPSRLDLRDVVLCAADSANVELTVRALRLCAAQCDFADVILFSDISVDGPFRLVKIEKLASLADYQVFRAEHLPRLVDAPFVLFVEWDGYIVNPSAWSSEFRSYDYIGAKWPFFSDGMTVGNSGFCLQSRKLLQALASRPLKCDGSLNVDELICRKYRPMLEREFGIRFAPEAVADRFAYENALPEYPTFGFHGIGNMWRHVDDSEMMELLPRLAPYVFATGHYVSLVAQYGLHRKFRLLQASHARMREHVSADRALQLLRAVVTSQALADRIFRLGEQLMSEG